MGTICSQTKHLTGSELTVPGAHTEPQAVPIPISQAGKPQDSWTIVWNIQKSLALVVRNNLR